MKYQPEEIWDSATWAEIDEVVAEEVKRVGVARRAFYTERVMAADGTAPAWISGARIGSRTPGGVARLNIAEGDAHPFVELSVGFTLTGAQLENESTLHMGKTLARMAAKNLALAEDAFILMGTTAGGLRGTVHPSVRVTNRMNFTQRYGIASDTRTNQASAVVGQPPKPPAVPRRIPLAMQLLNGAISVVSQMMGSGWPEPYALILGTELYQRVTSPLSAGSTATPASQLAPRARHIFVSSALNASEGIVVSLAGETTTLYIARDATTAFVVETLDTEDVLFHFRVFERVQYAVRDPASIGLLKPI